MKTIILTEQDIKILQETGELVRREAVKERLPNSLTGIHIYEGRLRYKLYPYQGWFCLDIPYQEGEEVAGLEEWKVCMPEIVYKDFVTVHISNRIGSDYMGDYRDYCELWQPPSTMPLKFSRFKLKVIGVKVQKLGDVKAGEMIDAMGSFYKSDCGVLPMFKTYWNAQNPEHPYDPELYTFATQFKLIKIEE